jgi:cytochrome P450
VSGPALDDPAFWSGDPYPAFAELRANDPVHRFEGDEGAFWAVARHADVQHVSKHPELFCSARGVLLTDLTRPASTADSIIYLDPPLHARRRRLLSPSLTVRRVADLEPRVRSFVRELLDGLDPTSPVDAVEALAIPLPLLVIAELVGVPRSDMDDFRRWSDAMIDAANDFNDESVALAAELFGYVAEIVEDRQGEPRDDLTSVLAHGTVDGETLEGFDIVMFVMTLLVAGNETTRTHISNSLVALADHPDQRQLLADDPTRMVDGVEELLRWEAPIMNFCRTATTKTEIGGQVVEEGDYVVLVYPSANRDEAVFGATAGELDVTRSPNPHVSFGFAEHFCMGAGLARLESRVLLEELLARWPGYELTGPAERVSSRLVRGIAHLPLVLQP